MMKRVMKGIKNIVKNIMGVGKKTILSVTLMVASGVVCMVLCTLQMYADAVIFFLFGLGTFWYMRLIRDEKRGDPWYELEDDIK